MLKKKCLLSMLLAMCLCMALTAPASAANLTLVINGQTVSSETAPEVHNGVTFVPLRVVSEHLGADVEWFEGTVFIDNYTINPIVKQQRFNNGAVATWTESTIQLTPGNNTAIVGYNGNISGAAPAPELWNDREEIKLLSAPYLKAGRVMVPLRFIAERMGCSVNYAPNKISIEAQKNLTIDGQQVKRMLLNNSYTTQKTLIYNTIKMIEESRQSSIYAPHNVKSVTPILSFDNTDEEIVASWQFYVPDNLSENEQPFSTLYLHDVLHNIWYSANPIAFDNYFQGGPHLYSQFILSF